jgi:hypothetical protein
MLGYFGIDHLQLLLTQLNDLGSFRCGHTTQGRSKDITNEEQCGVHSMRGAHTTWEVVEAGFCQQQFLLCGIPQYR